MSLFAECLTAKCFESTMVLGGAACLIGSTLICIDSSCKYCREHCYNTEDREKSMKKAARPLYPCIYMCFGPFPPGFRTCWFYNYCYNCYCAFSYCSCFIPEYLIDDYDKDTERYNKSYEYQVEKRKEKIAQEIIERINENKKVSENDYKKLRIIQQIPFEITIPSTAHEIIVKSQEIIVEEQDNVSEVSIEEEDVIT